MTTPHIIALCVAVFWFGVLLGALSEDSDDRVILGPFVAFTVAVVLFFVWRGW